MSEYWGDGVRKHTEEEQAAYDKKFAAATGQSYGGQQETAESGDSGYYAGYMPAADQMPEQQVVMQQETQAATAPKPSELWLADPVNFTAIEDKYKDPNYEDEHWSREQIQALGSEFAYQNQGKTRDQWGPLYDDNEFVTKVMSKWYDPIQDQQQQEAQQRSEIEEYYTPQTEAEKAFFQDRETKTWDDLKWWQKGLYSFFPGQADEGLGDAPDWTQKTRDAATAVQSAGAGAAMLKLLGFGAGLLGAGGVAAALTNPIVLAAAAVGMGGLLYYQSRTGKELPVINKIAEFTDLPDTITEHVIGTGIQTGNIAGGYIDKAREDPDDAYGFLAAINDTIKDVISGRDEIWRASEYTYEMYGGIGDILTDAANVLFEGDWNGTKLGEAWMFNKGESEKVQLAEGTYAAEGLETIRNLIAHMKQEGIEDELINSLIQAGVINSSGFSGAMSDNIGQMIFDLSMLAPGMENSAAEAFSKVTGFETGIIAAERNKATSIISDLPVVGAVYNGLTGAKSSGGINEWTEQAKIIARTKDVSQLSAMDRLIGGLDEQGRIKQLLPTEKQGLADWLPETKVIGSDKIAMDVINSQMSNAQTDTEVRAVLDNYVNGAEGVYNSPDVVSTRDAVAAGRPRAEVYFQRYKDGAQGRVYLQTVAEALGMEQKDVITMVETNPDVLTKRMQDYAAAHDGKIGTIDAASIDNTVTVLKGFTGKDALLWNINQLKALTTGAVFDGMNEFNIQKYGVKPDHFMIQMTDTIKSAQSLMLLGLSPSYLVNNVINNTVTSIAEGVFGLMTPGQMQTLFDEMGIVPARLGETLSEFRGMDGSMSSLDAMNAKISEAKQTKGLLTDIRGAIRKVNSKAGVFSNISGKFEELQGKQVTATAINQYWRQTWKAGVGFQAMPEALVNRIEAQNPGMTNMIYLAVERGMNMKAITKALYGEYIHADVSRVLKDVIAEQIPGDPTVFDELFVKSNILNEIEAAFSLCSTEEERAAALNRIRENTRQFINNLKRNELIDRAESIKSMVDGEGANAAQNILGDMAINRAQTWLLTRDEWGDLYKKLSEEKHKGPERAALISALNIKQRAAWEAQYAYEMQVLKGIMDGLGFETETNAQYIDTTIQLNNSWQEFYKEKDRLAKETQLRIQRRLDAMSSAEMQSGAISLVYQEEWNTYYDETEALYQEYYGREREYQRQLDDIFVKGYEKATGKSGDQIAQNLANIRDIRQQMATMQQEAHNRTRNMNDEQKAKFYAEFDPKYNALIMEIEKLQKANGTLIDAEEGNGYTDNDPVRMTPEQTIRARETVEAANTERERAVRERIGFMSRDEIREGWIEAGRSEREADLMMILYDKAAEAWARREGKSKEEFFTEAAKLKDIIHSLGEDWKISDAINILKQSPDEFYSSDVWKRIVAKTLTPEFESWFGKSERKDEYGRPQRIFHGSPAIFFSFLKDAAGSKTGRSDTKDVFYFVKERGTSKTYGGSADPIWHRVGERFFAYLEGRDVPGGDTNLVEQVKISSLTNPTIGDAQTMYKAFTDLITLLQNYPIEDQVRKNVGIEINNVTATLESIISKGTVDESDAQYIRTAYFLDDSIRYAFGDTYRKSETTNQFEGSGIVYEGYLRQENPLTVDYNSEEHIQFMLNEEYVLDEKGEMVHKYENRAEAEKAKNYWDEKWQNHINQQARDTKHDGVVYENIIDTDNGEEILTTTYVVFEANQFKSIWNDGSFNNADNNMLHQNIRETVKGTFEHADIGNIIRMLEASDVSTMVHESGHLFRRTLSDQNLRDFTQWAGFQDVTEFQTLEARYWANDPTLSAADKQRYVDAEEKFARGFEQYLIDGSAPTVGLKKMFKEFSRYLLSIYKSIKDLAVKDYSRQGEFVFDGPNGKEVLNINAEINGIKLRDIFDRMLADGEIDRTPGYMEAVTQQISDMKLKRARMQPEAQQRRAMADINQRVLANWNSLAEAEAFLNQMRQPIEIDGLTVDDVFLYDVIEAAKSDPKMNPFGDTEPRSLQGNLTYAASNSDPNRKYQFYYKVMELDDLIPSHVQIGDGIVANEAYPAELNPKAMGSQQDRNNVYAIAGNLNGSQLTTDQHAIDTGAPIIGPEKYVESGNARVLAMQMARQEMPENWQRYQEALRRNAGMLGIDPRELDSFENPVLVRERLNGYAGELVTDANNPRPGGESGMTIPLVPDGFEIPEILPDDFMPEDMESPALNQAAAENDQGEAVINSRKSNMQQTFDNGFAIPFDAIDDIELKGADDSLYAAKLRLFSDKLQNEKGYSPAVSLYAEEYLDWRLTEKGEEPHAATPLIEERVKADIDRMLETDNEDIRELRELRRPGAEVDNTPVPNKGVYVKQVYAFQHGDYMIAANVYVDGEFYGYLPEDLSQMTRTVREDGVVYKTLAIDPDDPRGLIYDDAITDEIRSVIPGKVDGIEGPDEPKEFIRPAKQGTTPDVMPTGSSYEEVFNKYLDPIMDKFGAAYESAETDARTKNFNGLDLETRALIEKWLDNNVKQDMAENKYRAIKYSDMKKDAAMLNYNERYGFDPVLTILSPYQFWYTRSMWQWAKRMIDKPRWSQMYSRMKDIEEEKRDEIMPSRLEGKFRIPMPWLPEWMGGGYYVDLTSQLFPFSQFGESYGGNVTQSVINAKAETILNEQYESSLISYEQMQEALSSKSGKIWEAAYAQAEQEASSDQMRDTLVSQFVSPNIFYSWYKKKQNNEDPGYLSSTRTGQALKTLTSGTGLESIGGAIGDAMALPEKALRKLYGMEYTEFGSYGDQQIRKQISQMCADGEITTQQALNAMNEKTGTIWDMAADRQRKENELRVPLFAGAEAVKSFANGDAGFGDVIAAMASSLLGGQIFPTGERELREMKASKDQAYVDKANGDAEAVSRWYDENPEYVTRTATYMEDPEELLKYTLYQSISTTYYAQSYAQQQGIKNQLGPEFEAALLNPETKNYKAVPVQKLAEWNARMGGKNPNIGSIDVEGVERILQYSTPVIESVDTYYAERDQLFPGISTIQDGYNALPKDQRKAYQEYFPQLSEYWDWNRGYKAQHPEYEFWNSERSDYYNEKTCYDSYAEMSDYTQQALEYARATNSYLTDTARYELARLYQKHADPDFMSFDEYIELLVNWK